MYTRGIVAVDSLDFPLEILRVPAVVKNLHGPIDVAHLAAVVLRREDVELQIALEEGFSEGGLFLFRLHLFVLPSPDGQEIVDDITGVETDDAAVDLGERARYVNRHLLSGRPPRNHEVETIEQVE